MIFTDFSRALSQLFDPRFRRVLLIGIALTVALLVAVYAVFIWFMAGVSGDLTLPVVGKVKWLGDLLGWASFFLLVFFSMFLMIPVASAITSLFLDDVAQAVEDEYYPSLAPAGRVSFGEGLRETVVFLGILIGANLLATVLYVMLPLLTPFIFYGMNGYLLGREYFQIWLAGCLMALPLSIPFVNLLIPVLGAATFTHLYHRLKETPRRAVMR